MTGPRVIRRHAFVHPVGPNPDHTSQTTQRRFHEFEQYLCAVQDCGLTYESPVHWILAEDTTQQEGWEHGSMGASNEFGQPVGPVLPEDQVPINWQGSLTYAAVDKMREAARKVPIEEAERVEKVLAAMGRYHMSLPQVIVNVLAAGRSKFGYPANEIHFGTGEKWDKSFEAWLELAKRN